MHIHFCSPFPHHSRQCLPGMVEVGTLMSARLNDEVWVTLMHELQSFVRDSLAKPEMMSEVRQLMTPSVTGRFTPSPRIAAAQIVRAFELLAPALMVDFLAENCEILNHRAITDWASERESLHEVVEQVNHLPA